MSNLAEKLENFEYLEASNDNNYNSNVVTLYGNGILFQSDLHRQYLPLEEALKYCEENNKIYGFDGDLYNDYEFENHARNIGLYHPQEVFLNYLSQNLSQEDMEAVVISQQLDQYGGLDGYLKLLSTQPGVSEEEFQKEKKGLEDKLNRTQTEIFQKRFQNLSNTFEEENSDLIGQLKIAREELYFETFDIQAREAAEIINKYDVPLAVNDGNHEAKMFWGLVEHYIENKEKLTRASRIGMVKVIDENGYETNIGALPNCGHIPGVVQVITDQRVAENMYGHLLNQGPDFHYKRIMDSEEDLHILMSHGQIGSVNVSENQKGIDVDADPSAVALSLEVKKNNGLIVEGHVHKTFEFVNSYGVNTIRSIGNEVYDVYRNGEGDLEKKLITLDATYDSGHNDLVGYDYKKLKEKVEDRVERRIQKIMQQQAVNDEASSEENQKAP